MFRKILFATVPMALAVSLAGADDGLGEINFGQIRDASVEIEAAGLDGLDVDSLVADAGEGEDEDAIEACFRRFGYRSYGYRYGYGCYRPCYSYRYYYPSYYCYRPVTYYTWPVVTYLSHWGCY